MTSMSQPLASTVAVSHVPPRDGETTRLLQVWVTLARQVAAAAAHGLPDEQSLLQSQLQVEHELAERELLSPDQLTDLIVWEAGLIHHDDLARTPGQCLVCRKAAKELPLNLPLPASSGGRR